MRATIAHTPDLDALTDDLAKLVRRGFSTPLLLDLEGFPTLELLADSDRLTTAERAVGLHDLLGGAISRLPEPNRAAMKALGEMEEATAGRSLGIRREAAAKALGVAPTTFRTHREPRLIKELAQTLAIEASESNKDSKRKSKPANNRVFVIHARDAAQHPLFDLLRAWGLQPQSPSWDPGPTTFETVFDFLRTADHAAAIVALLTPMGSGVVGEDMRRDRDKPERSRDNLMLELGLVLGAAPERTVIVSHGDVSLPTSLSDRSVVKLDNRPTSRNALRSRLQALGCEMDSSLGWLDPAVGGDFEAPPVTEPQLSDDLVGAVEQMGFVLEDAAAMSGQGSAWFAKDRQTGEQAVVKVFNSLGRAERSRRREAFSLASSITGKSLPAVTGIIETESEVAMVLDAVDGVLLDEIGTIPPKESVWIASELLEAVSALHRSGIAHRDISPSNILLTEGGHPVLIDFGACTSIHYPTPKGGSEPGKGSVDTGRREDTYAVGLVLLSLLKGQDAVQGAEREIEALDSSDELKQVLRRLLELQGDPSEPVDGLLRELRATPEAASD